MIVRICGALFFISQIVSAQKSLSQNVKEKPTICAPLAMIPVDHEFAEAPEDSDQPKKSFVLPATTTKVWKDTGPVQVAGKLDESGLRSGDNKRAADRVQHTVD